MAPGPAPRFLAAIAAAGLALITLCARRLVSAMTLVAVPTALLLFACLGRMVAARRVLPGPARKAAIPAALAVMVMLTYGSWALAIAVITALAACRLSCYRAVGVPRCAPIGVGYLGGSGMRADVRTGDNCHQPAG